VGETENGAPLPLPKARLNDPHLQDYTRYPKRIERIVAVAFVLGTLCFVGFGAAYWQNAPPVWLALTFGLGLFLVGFGLTAWGKYLMPQGPFVEERHPLASTPEERDAMAAAVVQRGGMVVQRRSMLGYLLAGALGLFGVVAAFPLLRSLGPLPGDTLQETGWRKGTYLVDINGNRIKAGDINVGGIVTVYPEHRQNTEQGQATDQVVLIRFGFTADSFPPQFPQERRSWVPLGYIAFSKLCTHLGCPVGLYEQQLGLLVCPCHQSMFNVGEGGIPQFGPAPRPLPQLPLFVEPFTHYLRAANSFQGAGQGAVGPGFWERSNGSQQL
jgi:ubiquinol-cytochrome c reductase iron-sulfur subunit